MAAYIPGFIKRPVTEICNLVAGRLQHEYDEGLLTAQTALRIAKERVAPVQEYVRGSVPIKVVSEYQKVRDTYSTMRAQDAYNREKAKIKTTPSTAFPCRVEKKRMHVSDFSQTMRQKEAALRNAACNPHRAVANRVRRRAVDRIEVQGLSRKTSVSSSPKHKPDATAAYMKSLRTLYPASDSYEERKQHADATFTSIFGAEHVHFGVGYASGHSGVVEDPVLAEHSYKKKMENIMGYRQAWQAEQRRTEEYQQQKKAEQEAERAEKAAVFKHYCAFYDERVRNMVNAGGHFHTETGQVLRAVENENVQALHQAAHVLITNTLDPILALFEEMSNQIALESLGAQELRNAWPTDSIEQVLTILTPQILHDLPFEVQNALGYMLQSLRAICQTIINAVPLVNPLNEPEPPIFEAKPIPLPSFDNYLSKRTKQASQQGKVPLGQQALPQIKVQPPSPGKSGYPLLGDAGGSKKRPVEDTKPETPAGGNDGKSFPSFAAMAAASKAAKEDEDEKDKEAGKTRKRY